MQSKPSWTEEFRVKAGARSSPLSRAQVEEVQNEIQKFYPNLFLDPLWVETTGDKDHKTSLRSLDKTDFFTKEIDKMLLDQQCRLGIHSAKDLPDPIPEGLKIIAITEGVDSSDALVFREGENLSMLAEGAKVATSSVRREEVVRQIRPNLTFIDIRGTIEQRLAKLQEGTADAVVIAEAALIRLRLTHLPRLILPGETTPGQGKLAVLAREEDEEMASIFSKINTRPSVLYLGLHCPPDDIAHRYLSCPIIKTIPRNLEDSEIQKTFLKLPLATHLIFTSQTSVPLFFQALTLYKIPTHVLHGKNVIAVGKKTAQSIREHGLEVSIIPKQETAEGIAKELDGLDLVNPHFFWPHSTLSRPVLKDYFALKHFTFTETALYDTQPNLSIALPPPHAYEQVYFTSPSTVDAYLTLFEDFPKDKELRAIGPVTAKYLTSKLLSAQIELMNTRVF